MKRFHSPYGSFPEWVVLVIHAYTAIHLGLILGRTDWALFLGLVSLWVLDRMGAYAQHVDAEVDQIAKELSGIWREYLDERGLYELPVLDPDLRPFYSDVSRARVLQRPRAAPELLAREDVSLPAL